HGHSCDIEQATLRGAMSALPLNHAPSRQLAGWSALANRSLWTITVCHLRCSPVCMYSRVSARRGGGMRHAEEIVYREGVTTPMTEDTPQPATPAGDTPQPAPAAEEALQAAPAASGDALPVRETTAAEPTAEIPAMDEPTAAEIAPNEPWPSNVMAPEASAEAPAESAAITE